MYIPLLNDNLKGLTEPRAYEAPKDYYKQIYFEVLDVLLNEISRWFDQATLKYPTCIENIILKAANTETNDSGLKILMILKHG